MNDQRSRRRLACGTALAALALGMIGTTAANAHVSVASDTANAGSYAVLTFSVPHGCEGSATTEVAIQVPEGINAVTPTRNANYSVVAEMEPLENPITDSHGNEVTERVERIVYTAETPLPDDQRDTFELSLQLPETAEGQTLYFPTVQTCEEGEAPWIEVPAEGQDPHELEYPAPSLEVLHAESADNHEPSSDSAGSEDAGNEADTDEASSSAPATGLTVAALIVAALSLVVAFVALLRGMKRP